MSLFPVKSPASFDFREVGYEKKDWVARVTINRPQNYNAYSTPALQELAAAFQDAGVQIPAVARIVGCGGKLFRRARLDERQGDGQGFSRIEIGGGGGDDGERITPGGAGCVTAGLQRLDLGRGTQHGLAIAIHEIRRGGKRVVEPDQAGDA